MSYIICARSRTRKHIVWNWLINIAIFNMEKGVCCSFYHRINEIFFLHFSFVFDSFCKNFFTNNKAGIDMNDDIFHNNIFIILFESNDSNKLKKIKSYNETSISFSFRQTNIYDRIQFLSIPIFFFSLDFYSSDLLCASIYVIVLSILKYVLNQFFDFTIFGWSNYQYSFKWPKTQSLSIIFLIFFLFLFFVKLLIKWNAT